MLYILLISYDEILLVKLLLIILLDFEEYTEKYRVFLKIPAHLLYDLEVGSKYWKMRELCAPGERIFRGNLSAVILVTIRLVALQHETKNKNSSSLKGLNLSF